MDKVDHISVMPSESLGYLTANLGELPVVVDATLGDGGHSRLIAEVLSGKKGKLVCIDVDDLTLGRTKDKFPDYGCGVEFVSGNFANIKEILAGLGVAKVDGILVDLGASSMQLDTPERGFSFQSNGPLDMRMGGSVPVQAFDVVNKYSADKLYDVIKNYGEERWARRIVSRIVDERQKTNISTTGELADIIFKAVPAKFRHKYKIHPATRTFQALRMEVNSEIVSLEKFLDQLPDVLVDGGRCVVISFHSLEDRIVKNKFRQLKKDCGFEVLTKKPLTPSMEEINNNRRARSAKMRVIEKISGE